MKAVYATHYDATQPRAWSGAGYQVARALENTGVELYRIGPLLPALQRWLRMRQLLFATLHQSRLYDREQALVDGYAREVRRRIPGDAELVFSPGTLAICRLETSLPIAFWTDATFAGLVDYYPAFSGLPAAQVARGNALEQEALDRCECAIYSSDWAAATARAAYSVAEDKIKVIPFGANHVAHGTDEDIDAAIVRRMESPVRRLLFIGSDWERKGGDIAVRIATGLRRRGMRVELHVVGCRPRMSVPDHVHVEGYVGGKSSRNGATLDSLYREAHCLIQPSRAECNANVFAEACSYGVPIVTTRTGGIGTSVRHDVNGITFPLDARIADYADAVYDLLADPATYTRLAHGARREFSTRLNWPTAARQVKRLLEEAVRSHAARGNRASLDDELTALVAQSS